MDKWMGVLTIRISGRNGARGDTFFHVNGASYAPKVSPGTRSAKAAFAAVTLGSACPD